MEMPYNPHMKFTDKIEDAKVLIEGIADDAQKILSMAQISIPVAEGIVKRIVERAKEAQRLFKPVKVEESNVR